VASAATEGFDCFELFKEIRSTASDRRKQWCYPCCKSYCKICFASLPNCFAGKWNVLYDAAKTALNAITVIDMEGKSKIKDRNNIMLSHTLFPARNICQ